MNKKYLVILSGGIKQGKNGQWVSTDITEPEDFQGSPGGKIRVIATSYLSKQNPDIYIIVLGGQGYDSNIQYKKHPGLANIIERELIELGIQKDKIIKENKSNTTYQQLIELGKILVKENIKTIQIISSQWHLPRIKAMIDYFPQLENLRKSQFIPAEQVCLEHDPKKWKKIIDTASQNKSLQHRIKLEQQGIKDIKSGKYKLK